MCTICSTTTSPRHLCSSLIRTGASCGATSARTAVTGRASRRFWGNCREGRDAKHKAPNVKCRASVSRTTITYDHIAARYAAREAYPLERELTRFRQMAPERGLVLDVGCGPGQYARALESRGLRVVALDLSMSMLRQAHTSGTPRLVRADMRRLPFASGCTDGCFACASLLHLPRTQAPQVLLEFHRVLRTGGALYVGVKEGRGEEWVADPQGYERFFAYYQPEEIDRLIQAAGFEIVDGWINPPGRDQCHNWINRFAVTRDRKRILQVYGVL
ncbi:MAG: hypothetical protein DRJ03_17995 [Chloroflexi bacterium]|nr:MAG: hypothetical protein DRJ03_17995 [Chloroflexota bacterium]